MKSLKTAVVSTLLLVLAAGLAFGQATANPKFPANANGGVILRLSFGEDLLPYRLGKGCRPPTQNRRTVSRGCAVACLPRGFGFPQALQVCRATSMN
jgi:hypothetical protein